MRYSRPQPATRFANFFHSADIVAIINDYYTDQDKGGPLAPSLSNNTLYWKCYYLAQNQGFHAPRSDFDVTLEKEFAAGRVIEFSRKEGGSLWDFAGNSAKSYVTPDAVNMVLSNRTPAPNPVQLQEAEKILSKAGLSLNVPLPPVRNDLTADEMLAILLKTLAKKAMEERPRIAYMDFIDNLKRAGFPATITQKEFRKYLETF